MWTNYPLNLFSAVGFYILTQALWYSGIAHHRQWEVAGCGRTVLAWTERTSSDQGLHTNVSPGVCCPGLLSSLPVTACPSNAPTGHYLLSKSWQMSIWNIISLLKAQLISLKVATISVFHSIQFDAWVSIKSIKKLVGRFQYFTRSHSHKMLMLKVGTCMLKNTAPFSVPKP